MKKFRGGIQKGTTAFDEASKQLDSFVKDAAKIVASRHPNVKMVKQLTKEMKIKYFGDDCFGFAPDGGAWFIGDKLVAVFEAKKQGRGGNAFERWYDNATTARHINNDVIYVTFCSGEGAEPGQCLDKLRRAATIKLGSNFQFVMSPAGFSFDETIAIIESVIAEVSC
jgi:hypothetical protein